MKLRKLFAGVAAAATLLGGMAFGATAANAADTASITLSGKTVKGTVYTAYKIGSYDTASAKVENDKLASVGVTTDQAWKTDAENVLGATVTNTPEYKGYGDPLAYVAGTTGYYTNTPATLPNASATMESFVQSLAGKLDGKTAVDPSQTVANDNDEVVFSGLDEGLYLIVSKTDTEPATDAGSPLAIVGTQVTVNGTAYTKLGANNQTLGKAVVKPSTPQKPSKSASDLNPYVGATITYTLEGTVPAKANSFKFVDTPSAGLTVKLDTLKVNVQGETDPLANTEYTVDPASGDFNTSAAKPSFTIALNNATKYQGKHIVVKYNALVNKKANVNGTNNDVRFDNSNQTTTTTITPQLNTVTFTKKGVDADTNALKGVVFQIVADTNNATPLPDGTATEATSGDKGVVTFSGLPNGTYTITEKTPADGYLTIALPSFTVTVENGKVLKVNYLGKNIENYDSMLVLIHFKGHPMGGYGGALKQLSIGCASSAASVAATASSRDSCICCEWSLMTASFLMLSAKPAHYAHATRHPAPDRPNDDETQRASPAYAESLPSVSYSRLNTARTIVQLHAFACLSFGFGIECPRRLHRRFATAYTAPS